MINAKEAYQKSIINSKAKQEMVRIEKDIWNAIKKGEFRVRIDHCEWTDDVKNAIIGELDSLGYNAAHEAAKPLPPGCPSDQWYSTSVLKVSWGGAGK